MNPRIFLATLAIFLGLTACSGGKDTTDEATGDDDDAAGDDDDAVDPPTADTAVDDGFFDIAVFRIDAEFSYDSTTRTVVNANSDYGEIPSALYLYYGTTAWEATGLDNAETAEYCVVVLPLVGATPNTTWTTTAGLWTGFDYDVAGTPGTNCNTPGYELDPASWGTQLEVDIAANYSWGIGIGALLPAYEEDYATSTVVDQILGAYINNTMLPEPEGLEGYVALGFQIDASYNILVDEEGLLTALDSSAINLGNNIATAYYRVFARLYWTFSAR